MVGWDEPLTGLGDPMVYINKQTVVDPVEGGRTGGTQVEFDEAEFPASNQHSISALTTTSTLRVRYIHMSFYFRKIRREFFQKF